MSDKRFAQIDLNTRIILRCFYADELSQAGVPDVLAAENWKYLVEGANYDTAVASIQADIDRSTALDGSIKDSFVVLGATTLGQLRGMTLAQLNTWWTANVTNLAQANTILKLLFILAIRKVLQ